MTTPHNANRLGDPLRSKKKRGAVFMVIAISVIVHVLGLGVFGIIKIVETIAPKPEFEAPPLEVIDTPPPPPPPPPTTKRMQRSMPRPQPLVAQNPQNMDVPMIEMKDSDLALSGGRGFGGGLGELGGGAVDAVRLTSFGFDRALEGTLTGTLFDFKNDENGNPIKRMPAMKPGTNMALIPYFEPFVRKYSTNMDVDKLVRSYTKADANLYASYFIIPFQSASIAPRSFGAEGKIMPTMIGVHYEGSYKPQKSGTFRLVGRGDDVLLVRINGKMVLDGSVVGNYSSWNYSSTNKRNDEENLKVFFGFKENFFGVTGDWFNLREGVDTEVEIFISEVPGGHFGAYILIEEENVPGLQIFSTRPLSDQDKAFLRKTHRDTAKFMK
ncbi:MAG: hypothetical protein ACSHX4_07805 [Opitutaceae bacterium]